MTGAGLRGLLKERGLSPHQFTLKVMDYKSEGLEGTSRDKTRASAQRLVKRWLSEKKKTAELSLFDENRAMVSRLLGVPEKDLMADERRGRVRARLSAAAAETASLLSEHRAELDGHRAELDELRSRVEALEDGQSRRRAK